MALPNILFICCDDGCDPKMAARLYPGLTLPNYERLASWGTKFERAYCCVPICEPARTAMMTGMSPIATKSFELSLGWDDIVKPEHLWTYRLRELGYKMRTQGKVFHGYVAQPQRVYDVLYDDTPFRYGYRPAGANVGEDDHGGIAPLYSGMGYFNSETGESIETGYYDSYVAADAVRKIQADSAKPDAGPYYWEVGFKAPHTTFDVPQRMFDEHPLEGVIFPEEWNSEWGQLPFQQDWISGNQMIGDKPDPSTWTDEERDKARRTIWGYIVHYLWMDEKLGEVLDAIEASPLFDNTIITFYSDHGYHLSDHDYVEKFTLYEQAAAAPMLIRVPGVQPRVTHQPVSHIDIGATLLDYCGIPVETTYKGTSVRQLIETGQQDRDPVPTFWFSSFSVVDKDLIRTTVYSDGSTEQFDLDADPWTKVNIWNANDPAKAARRDVAIEAAYDWGLLLVEQAADLSRPSLLQNYTDAQITSPAAATSFVALGQMTDKGWSPHYTMMFGNRLKAQGEDTVRLPSHVQHFAPFAWRFPNQRAGFQMNDKDNTVHLNQNKGTVTLHLEGGDDEIFGKGATGPLSIIVHGGTGNDILRLGERAGEAYGDQGDDLIYGSGLSDRLEGGDGNDTIYGGAGSDLIYGGAGDDVIDGGAGNDTIHADGGADIITTGVGEDLVIVSRTGRPVTITDLTVNDVVDLSSWAPLGGVTLTQTGMTVEVTAALEKLILQNCTVATARAAITGVTINGN